MLLRHRIILAIAYMEIKKLSSLTVNLEKNKNYLTILKNMIELKLLLMSEMLEPACYVN